MSDEDFITDNKDGTHSVSTTVLLANYRHLEAELQRTQLAAAELATTAARATAEQQQACTRVAEVEAELACAKGRIAKAREFAEKVLRRTSGYFSFAVARDVIGHLDGEDVEPNPMDDPEDDA